MDLYFWLIVGHIVGTVLGVGGATMIEVHLNMFLKDKKMDETERAVMAKDFLMTRIGMGIGLLTGVGFVVTYIMKDQLFRLADGVFWAKMAIFVIIIINAVLLHKHKIGLYWGSAFSFISWWTVMLLGLFLTNGIKILPTNDLVSFVVIITAYLAVVGIGAVVLDKIRNVTSSPRPVAQKDPGAV
jgi:hypothetical protein